MGDRANVYIHDGNRPGVYLYTHWDGTELPQLVNEALSTHRAMNRRYDEAYLTRIVMEHILIVKDALGEETGYGISAEVQDGADRIVDIDTSYGGEVTLIGYPYTWDTMPADPYEFDRDTWRV